MPAPRGRGGARGIAREGRHDGESQGSVEGQEVEDQFIRGREHAEKRKREGRQGGAEGSPSPANNGSDIPREITMNDIMQHLIDT
jgi:hypothetical protein